jgi:signal-transduction protein with cAMP-binding, CBS, and nucleotidyltransferase domain
MFVSEIMSTCVAECTEDMRLEEVFELIKKCDHGLVVVVDSHAHRVPIGIVTEHSICEQIIARGRNPKSLSAGSVIDSRIRKVERTDLVEKIIEMRQDDVAAIVVVDEDRRVCGLISPEKLKNIPRVPNASVASIPDMPSPIRTRSIRTSEIPAFGWIQ